MDRAQRVRCNGLDRWQVLRFPYSYHPPLMAMRFNLSDRNYETA